MNDEIILWGRSFEEYVDMFNLTEHDLRRTILGIGDGPADFNRVASERGASVTSVDPIYSMTADAIGQQLEHSVRQVAAIVEKNYDSFLWQRFTSPEHLSTVRMNTMRRFLADYDTGRLAGRYLPGQLPCVDLPDRSFELALCSHFLFLYSEALDLNFHYRSLLELLRIADEVRIFPLVELDGRPSRHLDPVVTMLETAGHHIERVRVPYEFQRGGNEMLVVQRQSRTDE